MKKILFFAVVAFSMVSCLSKSSFSQTYTADVSFECSETVYNELFDKDSIYVSQDETAQGFTYMQYPLIFGQKQTGGKFEGGFLMSYLKGEKDGLLEKEENPNDIYRVYAATGFNGSKTYAVFYDNPVQSMMPQYDIEFAYKEDGSCSHAGCYVNNTTLVARKVKEHFQDGDKLTLKAKGTKSDGSVVEVSIVLAEYTESKDSVMYNWTPFDLSKLGTVNYVDFEVVSTNSQVPGYFCLDSYIATINISY